MSSSNHFVEDALALELIDKNLYRSTKPLWHPPNARGIFGGAVIAQALSAAMQTVDPALRVHSLHSYFVLGYIPFLKTLNIQRRLRDSRYLFRGNRSGRSVVCY
jgi:acyl-CoA thioesterase II